MNFIDYLICVPLGWGAYKGFRKGFIMEAALFFALFVGLYGGFRFSSVASMYLQTHFHWKGVFIPFLSFLLVFFIILAAIYVFAKILVSALNKTPFGVANQIGGAAIGIIKWTLILSSALYVFYPIDRQYHLLSAETKKGSLLYEPVSAFAIFLIPVLKDYKQQLFEHVSLK